MKRLSFFSTRTKYAEKSLEIFGSFFPGNNFKNDTNLKQEIDGKRFLLETEVLHDVAVRGLVPVDVDEEGLTLVLLGNLVQNGKLTFGGLS